MHEFIPYEGTKPFVNVAVAISTFGSVKAFIEAGFSLGSHGKRRGDPHVGKHVGATDRLALAYFPSREAPTGK